MKPDFAIIEERKMKEYTALSIDTTKATYQGIPWRELGDFGKRKFENIIFIQRSHEILKFSYV